MYFLTTNRTTYEESCHKFSIIFTKKNWFICYKLKHKQRIGIINCKYFKELLIIFKYNNLPS